MKKLHKKSFPWAFYSHVCGPLRVAVVVVVVIRKMERGRIRGASLISHSAPTLDFALCNITFLAFLERQKNIQIQMEETLQKYVFLGNVEQYNYAR